MARLDLEVHVQQSPNPDVRQDVYNVGMEEYRISAFGGEHPMVLMQGDVTYNDPNAAPGRYTYHGWGTTGWAKSNATGFFRKGLLLISDRLQATAKRRSINDYAEVAPGGAKFKSYWLMMSEGYDGDMSTPFSCAQAVRKLARQRNYWMTLKRSRIMAEEGSLHPDTTIPVMSSPHVIAVVPEAVLDAYLSGNITSTELLRPVIEMAVRKETEHSGVPEHSTIHTNLRCHPQSVQLDGDGRYAILGSSYSSSTGDRHKILEVIYSNLDSVPQVFIDRAANNNERTGSHKMDFSPFNNNRYDSVHRMLEALKDLITSSSRGHSEIRGSLPPGWFQVFESAFDYIIANRAEITNGYRMAKNSTQFQEYLRKALSHQPEVAPLTSELAFMLV